MVEIRFDTKFVILFSKVKDNLLKEYIKEKKLTPNDYLFKISPPVVNKYFKRLSKKLFGDEESLGGEEIF